MRVGIVGAGITGLATTHHLAERDLDVVAFEAGTEPGGVVRSGRVDGRVLEYGPQRIRLAPAVADLVSELALEGELLVADGDRPLFVYADGSLREVPRSVRAFLRTDLLSVRGKLRVLAEPLTDPGEPGESAREVFERKFGSEAYRSAIEPLFGGIYASDPAEMPAEHALSALLALFEREGSLLRAALGRLGSGDVPPPASFADGLATLPRALYERHRPYVHLGTAVDAVRSDGDGYVLEAGGRAVDVDRVVVTAPAGAAASLLEPLEGATAAPLRRLRYNSLALVHLRADLDVEGFGYQVRRDEPLRTRGVTWNAGLFDRDGVHTAFFGGMDDPEAVELDDAALGETARREFRRVMGADPEVLEVTRLHDVLPAYDASWAALEAVELPEGISLATNYTARIGLAGRLRQAERVADRIAERA